MNTHKKIHSRKFYFYWSISFLLIIVIAFAPRYWIPIVKGQSGISKIIHWHAFFATAWILIYFFQTILVYSNNIQWHKILGLLSIFLAIGVFLTGIFVSTALVEKALVNNPAGAKPTLLINLSDIFLFFVMYILGIVKRHNSITHKRLMTLATIVLINAGLFRIGRLIIGSGFAPILLAIALTSAMIVVFTYLEQKRNKTAIKYLKRMAVIIISIHIIRIPIALTSIWASITDTILKVL